MDLLIKVEKLNQNKIDEMRIKSWPIWECEVSEFDWTYSEEEMCLFLEGQVTVKTDAEEVQIQAGDFVTFPKGLSCVWQVIKPVRKHYKFNP